MPKLTAARSGSLCASGSVVEGLLKHAPGPHRLLRDVYNVAQTHPATRCCIRASIAATDRPGSWHRGDSQPDEARVQSPIWIAAPAHLEVVRLQRAQASAAQAVRQALRHRRPWWAWVAACISALFQCQICSAAVGLPEPIGRTETSLARALPIMPLSHRESDCGRVMPRTSPMRVSSRPSLAAPPRLLKPASSAYVYATKPSVGTR